MRTLVPFGLLVVACTAPPQGRGVTTNAGGEGGGREPDVVTMVLATPPPLPALDPVAIPRGEEVVVHEALCSGDAKVHVGTTEWASTLAAEGFEVGVSDQGDAAGGLIAIRFRGRHLVGDLFASVDYRDGCRNYTFRFQRFSDDGRFLRWKSVFGGGDGGEVEEFECLRWFERDERFPFPAREYSRGCED